MIKAMETIVGNVKETGPRGLSAYEIYVQNGGNLSEEEWLESLKGEQGEQGENGADGLSAYEVYLKNGGTLSETEWLESLKGESGSGGTNDYNDLINKPTIPTKTSELENDSNFLTEEVNPTKLSELENDSGFITNAVADLVNYYNKEYIDNMPTGGSSGIETIVGTADNPINVSELEEGVYHLSGKFRYSSAFSNYYSISYGGTYFVIKNDGYNTITMFTVHSYSSSAKSDTTIMVYNIDKNNNYGGVNVNLADVLRKGMSATIDATYTFKTLPKTSKAPTDDTHFVNKAYVDQAITGTLGGSY